MKALRGFFSAAQAIFRQVKIRTKAVGKRLIAYVDKNPVRSFYISLGILLFLIILSNIFGNPKPKSESIPVIAKDVDEFTIGTVPHVKVLAQVEKSGVISITALTPGVVSYIKTPVGTKVVKGQNLLGLASNYQGGNSSSLSRKLAGVQYKNARETKDLQHDLIRRQRELAEKSDTNTDELRKITDQSIGETNDLIALNDEIITALDANIAELESTNVGGANDALILSTKQLKVQFVAARNGARQGARMASYNAASDKPPTQLSDMQRELTLRQLDLQEKMIDVNLEVARLQHAIASVVEGMMYPAAPITGVVERVSVKVGEAVNPGMELMVISGDSGTMTTRANAYIGAELAKRISLTEDSVLLLNGGVRLNARPMYVSKEGVSGTAHGVYFLIPPEYAHDTTENGYISVELPVGYKDTTAAIPYIPIDAVYQSKDTSTVFIDNAGVAEARTVSLGNVTGSFVEVSDGLKAGDSIIVSRTVVAGDKVQGKRQ